jgi:hypothetical protein
MFPEGKYILKLSGFPIWDPLLTGAGVCLQRQTPQNPKGLAPPQAAQAVGKQRFFDGDPAKITVKNTFVIFAIRPGEV